MKSDFNRWDSSPIEKAHLRFCKSYLATNKKASNIACRAELGRYPLKISIDQRVLNYILHLKAQPESTIVNQAFTISKQLHSKGQDSFYTNITDTLRSQNITIDNILTKSDVNKYVTNTKTAYVNFFKNKLENSTKLEFYKTFKSKMH